MKKIIDRILTVFLLCLFILPVLTMNRVPGKISESENRHLADFPEIFDKDGNLAPKLQSNLRAWFNDNLGFRSELVKFSSSFHYYVLKRSTGGDVEIGADGWLYFAKGNNVDIARGYYPNFDEEMLERICCQQLKIQEKLNNQGIEYVLVLPPSKVSIYPEFIQSRDDSVVRTPDDILADYLEEHTAIKVVRVKDALLEAKSSGQLYFKNDTHWNEYGAYIGCSRIIEDLNRWGMVEHGVAEVSFKEGTHYGDLANMLGNADLVETEPCLKSVITNPAAQKNASEEKYDAVRNLSLAGSVHLYENEEVLGPKILMYGDSMFGAWHTTELLAESCSELVFIWSYEMRQDLIDFVKPDVIIFEMAERNLNSLITKSEEFSEIFWEESNH